MAKYESITFFYPSKIMGGAEYLFLRMASSLINLHGMNIYYVDYKDGFVKNYEHTNSQIKFIEFNSNGLQSLVPQNTLLISPLSSILDVATYIEKSNPYLFFWSIHPVGLEEFFSNLFRKLYIPFTSNRKRAIGGVIDVLINNGALGFMDMPNFEYQKSFFEFKQTNCIYLPIPLEEKASVKNIYSNTFLNLAWIGRISPDKIFSLLNVLECCNDYLLNNINDKINFHVIGDGPMMGNLTNFKCHPNLSILYKKALSGTLLQNFLKETVDVLFAMGTSTLEGASLKIATVLVDYCYHKFRTNRFRWLYEAQGYSLGDPYSEISEYGSSFEEIISEVKDKSIKTQANLCYQYFLKHHELNHILEKFLITIDKSTFRHQSLFKTDLKAFIWINKLRKVIHHLKLICKKS